MMPMASAAASMPRSRAVACALAAAVPLGAVVVGLGVRCHGVGCVVLLGDRRRRRAAHTGVAEHQPRRTSSEQPGHQAGHRKLPLDIHLIVSLRVAGWSVHPVVLYLHPSR